MKKVVICTPSIGGVTAPYLKSLEESMLLLEESEWDANIVQEFGNPYISAARMIMTRKALDAKADVIVYIDYDLSWDAQDLLTLIDSEGDVVAGTYRFKTNEKEEYMGRLLVDKDDLPVVRKDGCLRAVLAPAGFLKVTKQALVTFMKAYPELVCGDPIFPQVDLFNHGARNGVWWGEDYAFCDRWGRAGGEIWTPPNINLNHHSTTTEFKGNLHEFLLKQEGGINHKGESNE
jgi:hypothetical protein